MTQDFLFRFDGSRENDRFLELARDDTTFVFAGKELRLGPPPGWIPDYLRVTVEEAGECRCKLAIIELERDRSSARVAARKYLPEPSQTILDAFVRYLERACGSCRGTADPRLDTMERLLRVIKTCSRFRIVTVGCQRHSMEPVEELALMDQRAPLPERPADPAPTRVPALGGRTTLSPLEHKQLSRTILVLDAVVRGWDKSGASFRAWRNSRTQPLRAMLRRDAAASPELTKLMLGTKVGISVDLDEVSQELSVLWESLSPRRYAPSEVLTALEQYLPVVSQISPASHVQGAFAKARPFLGL